MWLSLCNIKQCRSLSLTAPYFSQQWIAWWFGTTKDHVISWGDLFVDAPQLFSISFCTSSKSPRLSSVETFCFTTVCYWEAKGGWHASTALSEKMFNWLWTKIAKGPIARQQPDAYGRSRNDSLKSHRASEQGWEDIIWLVTGARWAAHLGLSHWNHHLWGLQIDR